MIGTNLLENLVQSVALSHRIKDYPRVHLLFLAAPESGKTTVSAAADAKHVQPIAIITTRSIIKLANDQPQCEYLLFNDLTVIRAMSQSTVNLLITTLNQITQGEKGIVAFAGKEHEEIKRALGIIGCLPMKVFTDHRAKWRELGFISRMVPFAYSYPADLVAEIKNRVDDATHHLAKRSSLKMPKVKTKPIAVEMSAEITRRVRAISDQKAQELGQLGIRLLQSYHSLIRAHAVRNGRVIVIDEDLVFLRDVDKFVSITTCRPLEN